MSSQPFLRNVFTDMTGAIPNAQHYDKCGPMELRMMECMEAYGLQRGLEKCGALYDDFKECFTQQKQRQRFMVSPWRFEAILLILNNLPFQAMRAERHRQWLQGERSSAEHYAPAPRVDSY